MVNHRPERINEFRLSCGMVDLPWHRSMLAQSCYHNFVGPERSPAIRAHGAAFARAVMGWMVLCAGVGLSITLARLAGRWIDGGSAFIPILQAVLASSIVVPAIVALRTKLDRQALAGMGVSRRWAPAALVGVVIGVGVGLLVWVPAAGFGWIRIERIDTATLLAFLAINTFVLLLYEAVPEELALRGYGWTTVRDRWVPFVATITVTVLFCLSSALISLFKTASALIFGAETNGIALVPPGIDPTAYLLQILLFGLVLIAARSLPLPGALFAAIAFHLTQLTVNRVILGGLGWIESGVHVDFVEPDAIALVLVHIALSGIFFVITRKLLERRTRA